MFKKLKFLYYKNNGFTLIELLVVIALVGLLAATSILLLNPELQFKKSRDTKRKADLASMQAAFELYRADLGVYPASITCGSALISGSTTYMKIVPCDPKNSGQFRYSYIPSAPANSYTIISCLENPNDSQKDSSNNTTYCTGGTTNWSYSVTNP